MVATLEQPKVYLSIIPADGDCEVVTIEYATQTHLRGWSNGFEFTDDWCAGFADEQTARDHGWFEARRLSYDLIEALPAPLENQ